MHSAAKGVALAKVDVRQKRCDPLPARQPMGDFAQARSSPDTWHPLRFYEQPFDVSSLTNKDEPAGRRKVVETHTIYRHRQVNVSLVYKDKMRQKCGK
jgi:hypothetical protein